MPEEQKENYWAYHKTSLVKEKDKIIQLDSTIYINRRDADNDNKVLDEIIHELKHLYDYSLDGNINTIIKKLERMKN